MMKKACCILAIGLLVIGFASEAISSENANKIQINSDNHQGKISLVAKHAPIRINGDSQYIAANGVKTGGTGTVNNPFVIELWDINASAAIGIWITNTTDYVVIQNCSIHEGGAYKYDGLYFSNVTHAIVRSNEFRQNNFALCLEPSCANDSILNNNIHNNMYGIFIYTSININVSYNGIISNQGTGIAMMNTCINMTIFHNNISYSYQGIALYQNQYSKISYNDIYSSFKYGISIQDSKYNRICYNNMMANNGAGSAYDKSHVQGNDTNGVNFWNTTSSPNGYGNYWFDWTGPDNNHDGIVDFAYALDGNSTIANDSRPLTTKVVTVSEYPVISAIIVLGSFISILLLLIRKRDWE